MKINKAYIIYIDRDVSKEYATDAYNSCLNNGVKPILARGVFGLNAVQVWSKFKINGIPNMFGPAACATMSHILLWEKIVQEETEPVIILEHDAILLEQPNFEVEDNVIYTLGYKFPDINELYIRSGVEQKTIPIEHHEGAHAYVITPNTARTLLEEIKERGLKNAIDDIYFLRLDKNKTKVPMSIVSPTPAVGWLRKSTIWKESAFRNFKIIADLK